ncbi:Type III restriction enzyme, res subunit [Paenibacillus sophorae]|uniref:DUF4263 domain-containing protein n=1 Tax=Paenibacillus sophorae TaxID=1333845 RepID=A0A1H8UCA0_9BACL|nr:Shedu anti-phage system protein SduA domain-containing protein [Paenibacillus sophorae]QWU13189.1 DUF4263 domain-containing protein [Paenibacillus sophorae]SEP00882.1 Type III restriction enzyme, res subunit [Paenibacillus sophorae]
MPHLDIQKLISKKVPPDYYSDKILLRAHQQDAISSIQKAIEAGKKNILLQMANGSGKSVIASVIAKLFLEESNAKKILCLSKYDGMQERLEHALRGNLNKAYSTLGKGVSWHDSRLNILTYQQVLNNDHLRKIQYDVIICEDAEYFPVKDCFENYDGYKIEFSGLVQEKNTNNTFGADAVFTYTLRDVMNDGNFIELGQLVPSPIFDEIHLKLKSINQTLSIESSAALSIKDILSSLNVINDVLREHQELFSEYVKKNIKVSDITTLAYKKDQLDLFSKLLNNKAFFEETKCKNHNSSEKVWQSFFENNTWIFGYGLNYIFGSPLENEKFEQVISGYNFVESGKRIDALMKTKGRINSICFVEMKTHLTPLLDSQYRNECWAISKELSGAIAQIQNYKYKTIKNISSKIEVKSKDGEPTGEIIYNYNPKAILLIGNLGEFTTPNGVNEDKLSSFEMFRKSIEGIEIVTFDELFERARFIIAE